MNLFAIKEKEEAKAAAIVGMRALNDKRLAEKRTFSAEEKQTLENYDNEIKALDDEIYSLKVQNKIESYNSEVKDAKQEWGVEKAFKKFSPEDRNNALKAWLFNGSEDFQPQHAEAALRMGFNFQSPMKVPVRYSPDGKGVMLFGTSAQTTGTAGLGGDLVQTDVAVSVAVALKQFGNLREVCRVLQTSQGNPINLNSVDDTGNASALIAQGSQLANPTEVDFSQVQLSAFKIRTRVDSSRELLVDSVTNVSELVGRLIGIRSARKAEGYFATGAGTTEPTGIVGSASPLPTAVTTAHEAQITYDELVKAYHSIDPAYRSDPSFGWMFHDSLMQQIHLITDAANHYIFVPAAFIGVSENFEGKLMGKPLYTNNAFPTVALNSLSGVVGAFQYWVVRIVGDLLLQQDPYSAMDKDQIRFYATERLDSNLWMTTTQCPLGIIKMGSAS